MRFFSILVTFLFPLLSLGQVEEARYALVIGNSDYPKAIGTLLNPVNDATAMADELKNANFQVDLVTNATYMQLREAVRLFQDKLVKGPKGKTVGLFYYAGHGVQFQDDNYLVPLDANVQYEDDIPRMCFPVQRIILANMERSSSQMNIIILDACRNNPFPATNRSLGGSGLGEVKKAYGSFVAYATAPGSVASDGVGKHGLYTQELLKAIRMRGLLIEQVFKEVRRNVLTLSNEKQYTWDSSNIIGDFYFYSPESGSKNITAANATETSAPPIPKPANEKQSTGMTRKIIHDDMLARELTNLTNSSIPFSERQKNQQAILKYFVVPYAKTNIMMDNRIDERLTAEKLLERLLTLPESIVKIVSLENSDSGRIIEVSIEILEP